MADDIRFSVNFWQHPKTIKLTRKGGLEAVRSLQILWCFCAQERTDGILSGMDIDDIEIAADWRGEQGRLVELLLSGNWLEQLQDGTYALHGWEERQAYVSKKKLREEQARAAAEIRWCKKRGMAEHMPEDAPQDAAHMPDSNSADADSCEQHCSLQNEHMLAHAQRNAPAPDPLPDPDPDPKGIKDNPPPLPANGKGRLTPREAGTNPRALGSNPRELGTNPRAQGTNPRAQGANPRAEDVLSQPDHGPIPAPEQPDAKKERRKRDPTGNTLPELRQAIAKFTAHEPLRKALEDFRAMRERIRKPLTGRALELILRELENLAPNNPALQVEIVNQSVMRGWQSVFALKGPVRASPGMGDLMGKNAQTMAAVLAARQQGRAGNERV